MQISIILHIKKTIITNHLLFDRIADINSFISVIFESVSLLLNLSFVLNKFSLKTRSLRIKLIEANSS
jgi:hypothetical protein